MAFDTLTGKDHAPRPAKPRSLLFAVRIWKEEIADGEEYRGSVRAITSGAFRGFRDWSDLVTFLTEQMEDERAQAGGTEGDSRWSLTKR
jgi:hypothetical protein